MRVRQPQGADAPGSHQRTDRRPAQAGQGQALRSRNRPTPRSTAPSTNMAKRQGISAAAIRARCSIAPASAPSALKARIKAELTWQQMVRGKFRPRCRSATATSRWRCARRGEDAKDEVGYVYTLYPVMVSSPQRVERGDRRSASAARRKTCAAASSPATRAWRWRAPLRDVAVREPITRSSADLPPQLRDVLDKLEVGHLTTPDVTPQGLQMFALCGKKAEHGRIHRPSAKSATRCSPSGSRPSRRSFSKKSASRR